MPQSLVLRITPTRPALLESRCASSLLLLRILLLKEVQDSYWEAGMIRKTSGGYKVLSEKGKNLGGPYKTKAQAGKRLRQVEFFKHRKG